MIRGCVGLTEGKKTAELRELLELEPVSFCD